MKNNIRNIYDCILAGDIGLKRKKIHISVPEELIEALKERFPYGSKSRLFTMAIAEKLKKLEEDELTNNRKAVHNKILKNTNWDKIADSFKDYHEVN